jgi:hypothetical protein
VKVRTPAQRGALGSLFLILAAAMAGGAWASASADQWIISVAAGILALWLVGLSIRAFR